MAAEFGLSAPRELTTVAIRNVAFEIGKLTKVVKSLRYQVQQEGEEQAVPVSKRIQLKGVSRIAVQFEKRKMTISSIKH